MSFKLQCQGGNPIKQTDEQFRRIAEIDQTRKRLNKEIPYNDEVNIKKAEENERLTSMILEAPKGQVMGSSGSLGLIMGGGAGSLVNLAKNLFKTGSKKVGINEIQNAINK